MTKSKLFIAVSLVAALAIGWQLNEVVSAKSTPQKVCVTAFGTLAKRTSCLAGETELASGKVRNAPIKKRTVPKGKTRLSSDSGVRVNTISALADENVQPLVSTLGSSVRSYTYVVGFPTNWTGTITTSCSETEVPIDVYPTWFIDGVRIPQTDRRKPIYDEWQAWNDEQDSLIYMYRDGDRTIFRRFNVLFDTEYARLNHVARVTEGGGPNWDNNNNFFLTPFVPGLSLYLTQLCAPLMTLENAG